MIDSIFSKGTIPILEKGVSFSYQRHNIIANNIANATTPNYQAKDLSENEFQKFLQQAIDKGNKGPVKYLDFKPTPQVHLGQNGGVLFDVVPSADVGVMSHNGNNVDVDKENAKMAKNALYYTALVQLLEKGYSTIKAAIAEKAT